MVIAVVCVLVFVVFAGGDDDGAVAATTTVAGDATAVTQSSGSSALPSTTKAVPTSAADSGKEDAKTVEKVVRQLFKALEDQDAEEMLNLMDPAVLDAIPADGRDAVLSMIEMELVSLGDMKFSGIEMDVQITSPTTATATLTAGTVTLKDSSGQETSEDIKDAGDSVSLELIKQNGKWYVTSSPFL